MGMPLRKQLQQGLVFLVLGIYPANQASVPIVLSYVNAYYSTQNIVSTESHMSMSDDKDALSVLQGIRDTAHNNASDDASCYDFATYVYERALEYARMHQRTDILESVRLSSGRVRDEHGWTDHMWIDIRMDGEWKMFDPTFNIAYGNIEHSLEAFPDRIALAITREGMRVPKPYISMRHFDFLNTGLIAHLANNSNEASESLTNSIVRYMGW